MSYLSVPFPGRQSLLAGIMAVFTLCATLLVPLPASAERDPAAEAFAREVADQVIGIVSNQETTLAEKQAAFLKVFEANADVNRIAAFTLGQYARLPTPEQRAEYIELVKKFVSEVYVLRLEDYSGQTIEIDGSDSKGKNALVQSRIVSPDPAAEPVPVEWWLLTDGDSYKLFDLKVLGIWLAQEQRSQFVSIINNGGGTFEALLKHLRAQISRAGQ